MAEKRWARGTFCWYELGTTDVDRAKAFYGTLFGWKANDVPMGPMGVYTLLQHEGQDLAGMYKLEGPQFQGVPPFWQAYVAVDNVDADSARAKSAGATLLMDPMDVPNVGRMAALQDPQGAMFSIYQAGQHPGTGRWNGAPGTFCWSELLAKDPAVAVEFYKNLFNWGIKTTPMGPGFTYTEWQVGGTSVGGMLPIDPSWGPVPSHWMNYVAVRDCDAIAKQAQGLGAHAIVPPTDIPGIGRFSILSDPSGASFAVIKLG